MCANFGFGALVPGSGLHGRPDDAVAEEREVDE
jgi:hypothetical protein